MFGRTEFVTTTHPPIRLGFVIGHDSPAYSARVVIGHDSYTETEHIVVIIIVIVSITPDGSGHGCTDQRLAQLSIDDVMHSDGPVEQGSARTAIRWNALDDMFVLCSASLALDVSKEGLCVELYDLVHMMDRLAEG